MKFVERSQLGRIYSGRPQHHNFQAPLNRCPEFPAVRTLVLTALVDIPTNVLERVSARV
jgi:hypothetical protein